MLKQQNVSTSLGQITVSSLTLSELRQLDELFQNVPKDKSGIAQMLAFVPVIFASLRKVHQDMSLEQLESGVTFDDLNALFNAVLEVSGLKKTAGESQPAPIPA